MSLLKPTLPPVLRRRRGIPAALLLAGALTAGAAAAQTTPGPLNGSAVPPVVEAPAPPIPPNAPAAPLPPGGMAPGVAPTPGVPAPTPDTATPVAPTPDASTPGALTPNAPGPDASSLEAPSPGSIAIDPATLPHDLSPLGMFQAADWVVKAVMLGLAFASLVTWTIAIGKALEFALAMRAVRRGLRVILPAGSLTAAAAALTGQDAVSRMAQAARAEADRSAPTLAQGGAAGLKERVASLLSRAEAGAVRRLNRGTGLLATIGSTAPFVGLFGTVWGIMNAFIGISESQTTNLAVVAPGIAEALLATALGLVAAIPAVIIYNLFARALTLYRAALGDAAAGIERLVSRDLDFRAVDPGRI